MSEKRRGLGRGLGALIPTSSEGTRPVDVFFPSAAPAQTEVEVSSNVEGESASTEAVTSDDAAKVEVTPIFETITVEDLNDMDADQASDPSGTHAAEISVLSEVVPESGAKAGVDVSTEGAGAGSPGDSRPAAPGDAEPSTLPNTVSRETSDGSTSAGDDVQWTGKTADDLVPVPGARFAELPVDQIQPNPRQPRTVFDEGELDELVGSIKEIGVLQPIVVRPVHDAEHSYELIMGERRWRATQAAGLGVIPAIIRDTDDADLLRDALLENLHRSALNPLEEAAAYRQLLDDFGCTHEELAERISRSRPQISNTLRLLRLPPLVQRRVAAGVLSAGHARALLGLTDGAEIERLAQRIVAEGLSVRATEEIVAMGDHAQRPARTPRAGQRSAAIDELAHRLSDRFETRVKVDLGKNKGRLTVEFASVEDLNRILDLMAPQDPGLLRQ